MTDYQLYKFEADWCGPCKQQTNLLEESNFEDEYSDTVELIHVDVDENPDLSNRFSVKSIPTMILIKGDLETDDFSIVDRFTGVTQVGDITSKL